MAHSDPVPSPTIPLATADEVCRILDPGGAHKPVLWVGAGLSIAAGFPSTTALLEALKKDSGGRLDITGDFTSVVDAFVASNGTHALKTVLAQAFAQPRAPTEVHRQIARLVGRGCFAAVVTTNYDRLLESALETAGVAYLPQVLDQNEALVLDGPVRLIKVHGTQEDWHRTVLSGKSYNAFKQNYERLFQQMDALMRSRRLVIVGSSMQDRRFVDWIAYAGDDVPRWHPVMLATEWEQALARHPVLDRITLQPWIVPSRPAAQTLWKTVADRLAPEAAARFEVTVVVDQYRWSISLGGRQYQAQDPLADPELARALRELHRLDHVPLPTDDHGAISGAAAAGAAQLQQLAAVIGERLTAALLDDEARAAVAAAIGAARAGTPRHLHIIVRAADSASLSQADEALALPWELLRIGGDFPVREGWLDLSREVDVPGARGLTDPTDELRVVATVAAPIDATVLNHEEECYRLWRALGAEERRLVITDLGTLDEAVDTMRVHRAPVLHFTGHGAPGKLLFESDTAESAPVAIETVISNLRASGAPLPRLVYLACCYGAGNRPGARGPGMRHDRVIAPELLERPAPSTAATLHRQGFDQVLGYFGPVGDLHSTNVSESFYAALNETGDALEAVRRARLRAREPVRDGAGRSTHAYPLGWAQLAFYHRGTTTQTTLSAGSAPAADDARHQRELVKLDDAGSVERLRRGFVGRRRVRSNLLRRWEHGQRLAVVCGLGGLGKTAACADTVPRLARRMGGEEVRVLALDGRAAAAQASKRSPIHALWQQIQSARGDEEWVGALAGLQQNGITGGALAAAVEHLAALEGGLIVYLDDTESLLKPIGKVAAQERAHLGEWRNAELATWWRAIISLSTQNPRFGLVASSRYVPDHTPDDAVVPLESMARLDIVKMMSWCPTLGRLPTETVHWLAGRVDGHPRTVEYLEGLVASRERALVGPGQAYRGTRWREDLIEPALGAVKEKLDSNLLLDRLWEALTDGERDQLGRACCVLGPVPWAALVGLDGSDANTLALSRLGLISPDLVPGAAGVEWAPHRLVVERVASRWDGDIALVRDQLAVWFSRAWEQKDDPRMLFLAADYGLAAGAADRTWPLVQRIVLAFRHQGRYREALDWVDRGIAAGPTKAVLGVGYTFQVQLELLAGALRHEPRSPEERLLLAEKLIDPQRLSFVLDELGQLLKHGGRLAEAAEVLERALAAQIKAHGTEVHLDVAASLHSLAGVLRAQGDLTGARTRLERSLEIQVAVFGSEVQREVAASLHQLAGVLQEQGDLAGARTRLERSLEIKAAVFGTEVHPSVATSLHQLAGVLQEQGDLAGARTRLERSLEISAVVFGTEAHPDVTASLHSLAGVLHEQGDLAGARTQLERVIEIEHTIYRTTEHYSTAITEVELGMLLLDPRMANEETIRRAAMLVVHAHAVFDRSLGSSHKFTRTAAQVLEDLREMLLPPE